MENGAGNGRRRSERRLPAAFTQESGVGRKFPVFLLRMGNRKRDACVLFGSRQSVFFFEDKERAVFFFFFEW